MNVALVTLFLPLLVACGGPSLTLPKNYAKRAPDDERAFVAVNARGVTLSIRAEPNDVEASSDFWTDYLSDKLRRQGYVETGSEPLRTDRGLLGRQVRFTKSESGRSYDYWLTVLTRDSRTALLFPKKRVYVIEAAGDKDVFGSSEVEVTAAIRSFDP